MLRWFPYFLCWLGLFALAGCLTDQQSIDIPESVVGMAPIYAADAQIEVSSGGPRPVQSLGKIYYKDAMIYATERGQGIHVIDNHDPANPDKIAFITISGNSDMAIKGDILYANSGQELLAIDISNLDSVKVISRTANVFAGFSATFPEGYRGFFECVDESKGRVVGWYETIVYSPQCWR